jgi:hypothetical protein
VCQVVSASPAGAAAAASKTVKPAAKVLATLTCLPLIGEI